MAEPARKPFAILLLTILLAATCAGAAEHPDVDAYVRAQMDRRHVPGLSLAVVKNGDVVCSKAYGLANVELNAPAAEETVFQIQSITKTFTASAVMMLVEEGKVSLDDPLSKYLDGTPESWKPVTIRHLLSHTSGIKDFINEPTASLRLDVSEEEVLAATAPRPLNFKPGEKYLYSNTGYHLLAMVIRKVTGQAYGDFLAERIFRPLGMTHTRVQDLSVVIPGRAAGYNYGDGKLTNGDYIAQPILSYGGGGVLSTALDMAKWDAALRTEKLLKRSTLEQMWTPMTLNDGSKSTYGLGWGVGSFNGHRYVQHSGGHVTGFQTFMRRYLDDDGGLTVIVLTNQSGNVDPSKIALRVAGMFDPSLAPPVLRPIEDTEPNIAQLIKDVYARAGKGELTAEPFEPAFWAQLSGQLPAVRLFALAAGPIESMALVERKDEPGRRLYRYRVALKDKAWLVQVGITPDGKICALTTELAEE
jgi:CubicO group peptidase (beta-lactamase class C family)